AEFALSERGDDFLTRSVQLDGLIEILDALGIENRLNSDLMANPGVQFSCWNKHGFTLWFGYPWRLPRVLGGNDARCAGAGFSVVQQESPSSVTRASDSAAGRL